MNEYPDAIEGDNDIVNAFLADPEEDEDASEKKPSKQGDEAVEDDKSSKEQTDDDDAEDEEASEETPEDDEDSEEGEGNKDDEDKAKAKKFADDSDETYVKIKVGDEEHEVPVKDLKRLWGQEAALTRNSQEVSDARKVIDAERAKNIAAYDVILKQVSERANEYRALPWTQLMKDPNVPADQLQALQAEATKAFEQEQFIRNELDGFMTKVTEEQKAERAKAAQSCIKALTTSESPHHIKGWNEAVYNDLRAFGSEMGLAKEMVNSLTDPGAFKVLHMAMQFKRGLTKVKTVKVNKTPTKIVKNSAAAPAARSSSKTVTAKTAVQKAVKSGSQDDAIKAFLALDGDD
ncbi:MAG: hypothetical protein ACHP7H_00560 [Hyphomicrobiales bacterium]